MSTTPNEFNINDLDSISTGADLLDKYVEVASATGENFKAEIPLLMQAIVNSQPGANQLKSLAKSVLCYDTTVAEYTPGATTLVQLDPSTLCLGATCWVSYPAPARLYRLIRNSATGTVGPVSQDGTFTGQKTLAKWVEAGSLEDLHNGVNYFSPFATRYDENDLVFYQFGPRQPLRLFTARHALLPTSSANLVPAPTGQPTDANWEEITLTGTGTITSDQISDATTLGRHLLTARDAATAQQLLDQLNLVANQYFVGQPRFDTLLGEQGALAYILRHLQAGAAVLPPAAPTAGQVDDTSDLFSFVVNPDYPSFAQYKINGLPGVSGPVYLDGLNSYVQNGRVYVKVVGPVTKGGLAVYVAGSGTLPDGYVLTNADLFTGAAPAPTSTALSATLVISVARLVAGSPLIFTVTAAGGTGPYKYDVVATNTATGTTLVLSTGSNGSWTPNTPGTYDIAATVTDSLGGSKTSVTRTLTVLAAANVLPVVAAGDDLTVTLPTNSAQLVASATDSDGTITTRQWTQKAGPSVAVITTPTLNSTTVASLTAGIYQFQFSATDDAGGTTVDEVVVTVLAQPAPTISRFSPASGVVGSTVILTGTSFGAAQGSSTVAVGGVLVAAISSWSNTNITAVVPAGATSGTVTVTTEAGKATAPGTYTVTTAPAWNSKPVEVYAFGDSRTYGTPDHSSPWPETSQGLLSTGAGVGNFVVTNGGQSGQGSDFGVSALSSYLLSKRDAFTYWKQLVVVWFGVNDQLHNPNWTAQQTLDNLRQIHQRLNAAGFATLAVTEPTSAGWDVEQGTNWGATAASKVKRAAINDGIRQLAIAEWGAWDVAPVDTLPEIQNMLDPNVSPDGLHFTSAINVNVLAPFFTGYFNRWANSVGVVTSLSAGGTGGKVKPTAPVLANAGRTITATAGNGLPASTLCYTLKGGVAQAGSSVTLANNVSYAIGEVAFYSVATGNYLQSDVATNAVAFPAVNTSLLYNTDFTQPFTTTTTEGWLPTNDYGDGRQQITIGDGAARFKGTQYDAISQQLHIPTGPAPAGNFKAVIEVASISGGRLSLKNTTYNEGSALNAFINTTGTHEFLFTTADVGELLKLKAEDADVYAVITSFYVVAV